MKRLQQEDKKPSLTLLCEWILVAWKLIPNYLVVNAFKKCCISNSLDGTGTEDNVVWDSEDNADDTSTSDDD